MKRKIITILFLGLLFGKVNAQNTKDCGALMSFGIYDKYQTFTSELQYQQIKEFFKNNNFSSRSAAESTALGIGLDILDVLGINFNSKSSNTNFEQWQSELIKSSYSSAVNVGLKKESIIKISDNITKIIQACLNQKGVHAYIIPSPDNKNFTFNIDFNPYSSTMPSTVGTISVSPSTVASPLTQKNYLDKEIEIGPQGLTLNLTRSPSETVTITYNTTQGSGSVRLDPVIIPRPIVKFYCTDNIIKYGKSAYISWNVQNAAQVELDGIKVQDIGTKFISPLNSKQYILEVTSLTGNTFKYPLLVLVGLPPAKLKAARVQFHTTDDDKDDDTNISLNIKLAGNTLAKASGNYGKFDDHTDSRWIDLNILDEGLKEELIGAGVIELIETPNGSDEWHFNWTLELTFTDGTSQRYDWNGGNVDHDRGVISKSL